MAINRKTYLSAFILGCVLFFIFFTWYMGEKQDSYPNPHEALLATEHQLLLIPAYKINETALFFFIKDKNNLGAAYVKEGLLGWKTGVLTWSPFSTLKGYEKLDGYQGQGEHLVYGFIRNGNERSIKVNGEEARILDVEMLPEKDIQEYGLEGLFIWYYESESPLSEKNIELYDRSTGEMITAIDVME